MSPKAKEDFSEYPLGEVVRVSDFYKPWPHQEDFHLSNAKFRLQVGSFGSGKSRPLLMEAVFHAMEYPGTNSIILRKTIPDLKRTVIDKFKNDVPEKIYERGSQKYGTYNETDHIVYWPPVIDRDPETGAERRRQSKIYFGACETEKDVGKYLSTEFVFVGFEELGEFPYIIWDALEGRCRSTSPGTRPCMGAATNPMGIGWSWIKRLWVDHLPVKGMDPEKFNPKDYEFFHSTVDQNPILSKDKSYIASLEKSPLRDRIRYGKLNATTGQYFENWDEKRHVRPASDFRFEPWQPTWAGWDYGFGHYAVITFWTKAWLKPRFEGDKEKLVNVMVLELVLERHDSEKQVLALLASLMEVGKIVGCKEKDDEGNWQVVPPILESIHFSWERFNPKDGERSIADEVGVILQAAGQPLPTRSSTDRVAGWTKMFSMLEYDEWFILQGNCPSCVSAMPVLVRGDGITTSLEDVIKPKGQSLDDDAADSMRYAVAGVLLDEGDKPKEQKLREKLAGIKDPMAKHVAAFREYNKEMASQRHGPREIIVPSWVNKVRGKK